MANCPNCGAELAPSVLSCARCRAHITYGGPPPVTPQSPFASAPPPPTSTPVATPQPPTPHTHPYSFEDDEGPSERERRNRRNTVTLISMAAVLLAVALVAGIVVLASTFAPTEAEPLPPVAPTTDVAAPPASEAPTSQVPSPTAPPSTTQPPTTPPPTTEPPEVGPTEVGRDARWCSDLVAVPKSGTSCEFAAEVADAVAGADPEAAEFTVHAASPVTQQDYTMSCVRNSVLITCTGGVNATVWIKVGGTP